MQEAHWARKSRKADQGPIGHADRGKWTRDPPDMQIEKNMVGAQQARKSRKGQALFGSNRKVKKGVRIKTRATGGKAELL